MRWGGFKNVLHESLQILVDISRMCPIQRQLNRVLMVLYMMRALRKLVNLESSFPQVFF